MLPPHDADPHGAAGALTESTGALAAQASRLPISIPCNDLVFILAAISDVSAQQSVVTMSRFPVL